MKAKDYLNQLKKLDVLVQNKIALIRQLRDRAESTTACGLGTDRVQTSNDGHNMEKTIVSIIDLKKEIENQINELMIKKREVVETIDSLDNVEMIDLLYKRYVLYESWDNIIIKSNYSAQGIYKMHGKALEKLQTILDKR